MCQQGRTKIFSYFLYFSLIFHSVASQGRVEDRPAVKFLVLFQNGQDDAQEWMDDTLRRSESNINSVLRFEHKFVKVDMDDNESFTSESLCKYYEEGYPIVLDMTWGNLNWIKLYQQSLLADLPYFKLDVTVGPTLRILDAYLKVRNATDVTVIFEDVNEVHEALFYWVDKTSLRMLMMEGLDDVSAERLRTIRPLPSFYVVVATTDSMLNILKTAKEKGLMRLAERWILLFLDMEDMSEIKSLLSGLPVSLVYYDKTMCCSSQRGTCDDCPSNFNAEQYFFGNLVSHITSILNQLQRDHPEISSSSYNCTANNFPVQFQAMFNSSKYPLYTVDESHTYSTYFSAEVEMGRTSGIFELVGKYNDKEKFKLEPGANIPPIKKFYRIGTAPAIPWTYPETDSKTKLTQWTGYCVDFAAKLADIMNFDYELVIPKSKNFGKRDSNGYWDGTVGDLVRGDTDMVIGALTMTAEREEVIDFVAPYFEQTGISIVMRKPVRKTSLFKFMTVLRLEVWLSIVAALVVTGFMIWILDKYSPYSARNNAKAYPYPCRKFTLKESFWFALTSFTPQGGGEAPKALSGRTLVAAYWLFVVLMLATFTANLAAFLTVERMQSPVQSLEQLAKQSRINYTVMKNSWSHQYFINMKFAEDTLYRLWKELTLNASTDQTQYRVWDYPIREQYGHILLAINDSMPVDNATEGFQKVVDHIDADFAFIHDSSEIKYEISRNCNLTEIGEVFAERPYAVAVQQGSYMSDDISKAILDLQKERFFEGLKAKYWNNSVKGICPDSEDSEGITLESLGGVFIATLFGLALAMLTLLAEVIYYKKKKPLNKVTEVKPSINDNKIESPKKKSWFLKKRNKKDDQDRFGPKTDAFTKEIEAKQVTIGSTFQPVLGARIKPASENFAKGNYFTVYSRPPLHPDKEWSNWDRNYLY